MTLLSLLTLCREFYLVGDGSWTSWKPRICNFVIKVATKSIYVPVSELVQFSWQAGASHQAWDIWDCWIWIFCRELNILVLPVVFIHLLQGVSRFFFETVHCLLSIPYSSWQRIFASEPILVHSACSKNQH